MKRKCRLWWPKQLSPCELSSSCLLFGWFVPSPESIDVVVAFTCSELSLSQLPCDLEGIICDIDRTMPTVLQDKSAFCLLGQCAPDSFCNGVSPSVGTEELHEAKPSWSQYECGMDCGVFLKDSCGVSTSQSACSGGFLEQFRHTKSNWVLLTFDSHRICENSEEFWIPKLHHICWNGQKVSIFDVHVIFYDFPVYSHHHFSLQTSNPLEQGNSSSKKPKWVDKLQQKTSSLDLSRVILAINCVASAKREYEKHLHSSRSLEFSIAYRWNSFIWNLLAVFVATVSTFFYMVFQFFHSLHLIVSQLWVFSIVTKIFTTACIYVRIRCCQFLYWPIILQGHGLRTLASVEYAEKVALQKHSMWSSIAADILLGNAIGVTLLCHVDSICLWVLNLARDITNDVLRSGCVWLMGAPAGFKLNIELAGVLGIISLNAIQIWSTLWIFFGFIFTYVIKAFAILGILFGATLPAALTIDLISLATSHVSTLHWFISLLYSSQIQALAALWRLFRGQKQNPLRQRLDSYDYIVKQHIVGSLMFTPLLLLLPTTSVFYVFFSIMNSAISFTTLLIEVIISVIHATPYTKIFLWLVKRKRFPSGVWFETVTCQIKSTDRVNRNFPGNFGSPSEALVQDGIIMEESTVLVSCLHSNFMSIGELVSPHYRSIFSGFSRSVIATTFRGALTGRRMKSVPKLGLPSQMSWMHIPYRDYWRLSRDSILMCRQPPPCSL